MDEKTYRALILDALSCLIYMLFAVMHLLVKEDGAFTELVTKRADPVYHRLMDGAKELKAEDASN